MRLAHHVDAMLVSSMILQVVLVNEGINRCFMPLSRCLFLFFRLFIVLVIRYFCFQVVVVCFGHPCVI